MPRPVQGILDFETGSKDGFANWQRERDARLVEIRREWSLPTGRRVQIDPNPVRKGLVPAMEGWYRGYPYPRKHLWRG